MTPESCGLHLWISSVRAQISGKRHCIANVIFCSACRTAQSLVLVPSKSRNVRIHIVGYKSTSHRRLASCDLANLVSLSYQRILRYPCFKTCLCLVGSGGHDSTHAMSSAPKLSQGGVNHEVHIVNWNTGILAAENAEFTVRTSLFNPSLTDGLCTVFASNSQFMCFSGHSWHWDSPPPCHPLSSGFALHGLCAFDFSKFFQAGDLLRTLRKDE